MPTFVPINPPPTDIVSPSSGPAGESGHIGGTSKAKRIEEQICQIVQDYKSALYSWSNGQMVEARSILDRLAENTLIAEQQEAEIESECRAYSSEHGGVDMDRLRSLIFTGSGIMHVVKDPILAGAFGSPQIDVVSLADTALANSSSIISALQQFLKAEEFTACTVPQYLMIGQCAMLLGQLDIAVSAFSRGFESQSVSENPESHALLAAAQRMWPRQWWCAQEMIRALLMRGDADLALKVASQAGDRRPDVAKFLHRAVEQCVGRKLPLRDGGVGIPPAVHMDVPLQYTRVSDSAGSGVAVRPAFLQLSLSGNGICLASLGESILEVYNDCADLGSDLIDAIPYKISQAPAVEQCADASTSAINGMANSAKEDIDNKPVGSDVEAGGSSDEKRSIKRAATEIDSASGDEMPVKRRSTRFIERASSAVATGNSLSGSAKPSSSLSQQLRSLSLCSEPTDSEAFSSVCDCAIALFESRMGSHWAVSFDALLGYASRVASVASKPGSSDRGLKTAKAAEEGWCFEPTSANKGSESGGEYIHSLRAFLAQQSEGRAQGKDESKPASVPNSSTDYDQTLQFKCFVGAEQCEQVLSDNGGLFDLLQRLYFLAVSEFRRAPQRVLRSVQLRQILVRVLMVIQEAAVDAAVRNNDAEAIMLALVLVSDAQASYKDDGVVLHMRDEWIQAADRVSSNNELEFAKAWVGYEASVLENDLENALLFIKQCKDIGACPDKHPAMQCSFSKVPVDRELVDQRLAHLTAFEQLSRAERLAASVDKHDKSPEFIEEACQLLRGLLADSAGIKGLGFAQCVQAARLLADLENRRDNGAGETHALAIELDLYCKRMLDPAADAGFPARKAVVRCADLLAKIHDSVSPNADFCLSIPDSLSASLAALGLGLAHHFALETSMVDANIPEARFVALSLWLAVFSLCNNADTLAFLSAAHDFLGERGMCTAADGVFLKHILALSTQAIDADQEGPDTSTDSEHWDAAAACMRCLFDVRINASDFAAHACEQVAMDAQSADAACRLVAPELQAATRSRRGTGLRGDLKAIVDKVAAALGEIDVNQHPHLSCNVDVIDNYLDGLTMPTFRDAHRVLCGESVCDLPFRPVDDSISTALRTLPFVRAATQHDTLRFRMHSGMSRAIEDYDSIIDDYKLSLALAPRSAEVWHHLAQAFSDLADELLLGTAAEILDCRYDIASLQRLSLSCCLQTRQLLHAASLSKADAGVAQRGLGGGLQAHFYSFTGRLLYRIAAQPLPCLALQMLPSNVVVSEDEDHVPEAQPEWNTGNWAGDSRQRVSTTLSLSLKKRYATAPSSERVYSLARSMLSRAAHLSPTTWKCSYVLAKTLAKLGEPTTACALYLKACHIASKGPDSEVAAAPVSTDVADDSATAATATATATASVATASVTEATLDPLYKLLATLCKLAFTSRMPVATALRFVDALPFASTLPPDAREKQLTEVDTLFARIRLLAVQMCAADKRRWNHRPMYLLAWIDHYTLGQSEDAKQTLLSLLQMRNPNKQLATFYKSDSEAPGKHYLYLEKYLLLYIKTLVATSDIEGVQLLVRKLKRSSDSLYNASLVMDRAAAAEISVLQRMVHQLNCPRFVVDNAGSEHIVLQDAVDRADISHVYSITRHCRLNRSQFNSARDHARDNISYFSALAEHLKSVSCASSDSASPGSEQPSQAELEQARQLTDKYLGLANQALLLFGHLLDRRKKHEGSQETIDILSNCLSDLYILLLSTYGQSRKAANLQAICRDSQNSGPAFLCRAAVSSIAPSPEPHRPEASFWQSIIFDEVRNESSQ
ncbi:Histone transcription regulator 3, partial [Coemansia sp. RSA 1286]